MMLERLARYTLNGYFIFGPGTWREREDREAGSTVQEENDLSLLYHDGPSVLIPRSGAWTGGPRTHQSKGGSTPPSIWRWGHLDLAWLPVHMGHGPGVGGAVSWAAPFFDILYRSVLPVHTGSITRTSGGELPEHSNKVLVFLSLSLFLVRSQL
jgi:hypothetical protein